MSRDFYPREETLGENCMFWHLDEPLIGCCFPKAELMGRLSCEGIIDDVCVFIKDGRKASSLSEEQMLQIKTRVPDINGRPDLPPGNIT